MGPVSAFIFSALWIDPVLESNFQIGVTQYEEHLSFPSLLLPEFKSAVVVRPPVVLGNGAFEPPDRNQSLVSVCSGCIKKSLLRLFILKGIAISLVNYLAQEVYESNLLDPHSHLYHLIAFLYNDLIDSEGEEIEAIAIDDSWYEDLPQPFLSGLLDLYDELLNSTTGYLLLLQWYQEESDFIASVFERMNDEFPGTRKR